MDDVPDWLGQYRAALNETDASKRLTRIQGAERTLKVALRRAIENGDSAQRHAISEALRHLNLLQTYIQEGEKCLKKLSVAAAVSIRQERRQTSD